MVMYGLDEGLPGFTGAYGNYGIPGMYGGYGQGMQSGSTNASQGQGMGGFDMHNFMGMLMQAMRMYQQKGMQMRGSLPTTMPQSGEQPGYSSVPQGPGPTHTPPTPHTMQSTKAPTAESTVAQPLPEAGGSPIYWRTNKGWM